MVQESKAALFPPFLSPSPFPFHFLFLPLPLSFSLPERKPQAILRLIMWLRIILNSRLPRAGIIHMYHCAQFTVLGIEPGCVGMLGKHSTN
ncbi:hypothetical protein I79_012292 [Cricetulus griseus]|uniref:Uncharacterized protein n=1 Tax=Cricetulus griseus TaxID=10029 RepID=G3HNF4_CRIGR|nr:hypothetical protein I79_012292 [Cricetulus griseus]